MSDYHLEIAPSTGEYRYPCAICGDETLVRHQSTLFLAGSTWPTCGSCALHYDRDAARKLIWTLAAEAEAERQAVKR